MGLLTMKTTMFKNVLACFQGKNTDAIVSARKADKNIAAIWHCLRVRARKHSHMCSF